MDRLHARLEERFRVRRDIRYRNSFLPLVWGRIVSGRRGSRVRVTVFMQPLVAAFMAVWFYGLGSVTVSLLEEPDTGPRWAALFPLGLLLFGVVVISIGFFSEAIKARRLLEHALGLRL